MKKLLAVACLAASVLPVAAADVGVSISISQPGVYGRVDIGRFPQPVVVAPQPVIIGRPVVVQPEPVYLWVPPGHRKNWRKHCGRYGACGVPVYFVDDGWYDRHVMAGVERRHDRRHDRREDRYDDRYDDRGHGKGKDKDKGKGKD